MAFYWARDGLQEDRRASNASCGEGNMCRLCRVDTDFLQCEPVVEEGEVALEALGCNRRSSINFTLST